MTEAPIDRRQWILNHLELGKSIIDIGAADGWILNNTPYQKYTVSIDIDKYNYPDFYRMSAEDIKFPDKMFEFAILGEILEHTKNPIIALKEAARVAKRLIMTIPNEAEWDKENFPFESLEEQTKRRNLTVEEIAKISNPNAIEFHQDDFRHLFHCRHYDQSTLERDLHSAGINNYKIEKLTYGKPQWSFFVVDADCNQPQSTPPIQPQQPIQTGPIIIYSNLDSTKNKNIQNSIVNVNPIINIKNQIQKLRIALISTPFFQVPPKSYGGLEQVVYDLAMGLDALNHEVTVFGPEGSTPPPHGHLITTGPSIDTVGVDWFEEEKKRYEVYKNIIAPDPEKYDVIHDHTWFSFVYLLKMSNPKLKILHTHHGGMSWDSPPPSPIKPNLVAISKWMKQYTEQYFKQKGFNIKSEYVYNCVDIDKYKFQATKTDHLLFVGRLSTFKAPHIAVEVARKSKHRLDIIGGTFVDSIEYVKQLEKSIEDDPDITLYKDASHELKIEKLQNAKALLIPSKFGEPFGLVALEAMSCGTPVIAFDDGALKEIILDGITGYICDTEEQMVHIVNNRIKDIDPKSCRMRAELFSRLNMAKDYQELYYKVMNNEDW